MKIPVSPAVQAARQVRFESADQYRVPYSRELEGKSFELVFDDGYELLVSFPMRDRIQFQGSDSDRVYFEEAHVLKADDEAYFLMTEIKGSEPRTGFMLLLDTKERLVTGNFVQQGTRPDFKNLVTRKVRFGAMKAGDAPLPEKRHEFTHDLEGKAIEWQYKPNFSVIHVYLADNKYTVAFSKEQRERMKKEAAEKEKENPKKKEPQRKIPDPYWDSCVYVKFRENLYMFSFIEENLGSGTEGLMIINTDRVHDVGCFWGADPHGNREGYMFCAYGTWVREHLPEQDILDRL
ncbi:MAG: MoaF N-terminal domain-containing protein [Lachnospiraceae bacterium]|nr:MoaF N-terminal domain-containing protein [Lachnospiraceae bacterium]